MKVKKYTKISIVLLGLAIAIIYSSLWHNIDYGFEASIIIVATCIFVSLISVIKERTALSVILFFIFLLPVAWIIALYVDHLLDNYKENKWNAMTEVELIDANEKISGKRPLCLLDGYYRTYLLDIARIDSDTIGDDDILLQYEIMSLGVRDNKSMKLELDLNIYRDIRVIHYRPCEDNDYKVRYYEQYSYHYKYKKKNKSYNKIQETDDSGWNYEWMELKYTEHYYSNLLKYYEEHKSEIPIIAAEKIKREKIHVKYRMTDDSYELIFKTLHEYSELTKYLKERYGATISDISEDDQKKPASVKIGETVITLYPESYRGILLEGSLNDQPMMEQIANDFETYMAEKKPTDGE